MALAWKQPSHWSGSLQWVAVTFGRDLTGLMHINNECGVNVTPRHFIQTVIKVTDSEVFNFLKLVPLSDKNKILDFLRALKQKIG